MACLEIPFTAEDNFDLQLLINNKPIDFDIIDNTIIANLDFFGLAMLTVKSLSPAKIQIKNVFIDKVSVRQFLFLSWAEKDGEKIQPCTELWEEGLAWHIPVSNPMSLLISIANEKFETWELGGNLFEKYDIYYPESVEIDNSWPLLVKDFFKYNFDFYARKKIGKDELYGNSIIPYFQFDFEFDRDALCNELKENYQYLITNEFLKPYQYEYNQIDSKDNFNSDLNWRTIYTYAPKKSNSIDDFTLDKNKLPILFDFYKNLPVKNIYVSFVGILPPGGYIAPHIDHRAGILPHGCTQLYFTLNPTDDHYFKINGVGLLPLKNNPTVINNQNYTHTVINQSSEMRYAIGLFADIDHSFFKNIR